MVVPAVINAVLLLPELTIPVASLNDDVYHYLFIQNAAGALDRGDNVVDHWLPRSRRESPSSSTTSISAR